MPQRDRLPNPARAVGRFRFLSRYPRSTAIASAIVAAAIALLVVWFQPHKLFLDRTVDERRPGAAKRGPGGGRSAALAGPGAEGSKELAVGWFRSLEHSTSGKAVLLESSGGRRFLRLEDLRTSNGPDLRVYLSQIPARDDWYAYGERFVDLGALKGNVGDQNYALPENLDLSRFRSAVIWCRRFTVGFGVAPLDGLMRAAP